MQQKHNFFDGMDSDTSPELMPEGRDRFRLNIRSFSSGNLGAIETVNGNTLVAFTLPGGNNTVIGSKEYIPSKKLYYFVYNANRNHSILEYDSVGNTIAYVISGSFLNFNLDFLIIGINVIELDAVNHLLYWTDYNEEPKKINIEKGKFFMTGNFIDGYTSPFNPENIFRIKQPHLLFPIAVYGDDASTHINRLVDNLFQFKIQYVYDDKESSSWGPISKTVFPLSTDTVGKNNKISVTIKTGIDIVRRIRIAARLSTSSSFFLVADLDKTVLNIPSNADYVYDFYNDGNYSTLEINESIKLYDNVPKKSKAQEIIKGNREVDGNIVEGFNLVNVDLDLGFDLNQSGANYYVDYATITEPGQATYPSSPPILIISGNGTGATAVVTGLRIVAFQINNPGLGISNGSSLNFYGGNGTGATAHVNCDILGRVTSIVLDDPGTGYTLSPMATTSGGVISADIDVLMEITQITITNGGSGYTNAIISIFGWGYTVVPPTAVLALSGAKVLPVNALKRGGAWTYGAIYYDHGNRSSVANVNDGNFDIIQSDGRYGTELFIPFYTEPNPLGAAQLSFTMKADGVNIISAGNGYSGATTFTFTGGSPSIIATATPLVGAGKVTKLMQANVGAGYTPDGNYTVNLSGGSGTGAKAYITITGGIVSDFQIFNAGTGYLSTDTLTVSTSGASPALGSPTTAATFTIITDFKKLIGATITNPGSGYTSMPTIVVADSGGGTGGQVNPTMKVDAVTIVSGSSGYTTAPIATFIGGNPAVPATITTTIVGGTVTSTTVTNAGAGYLSFPILKVEGRVYGGSYPIVDWKLFNEPPSWATHYQIVRTLNNISSRYLQFVINTIEYLDIEGIVKPFGDPNVTQARINISNILNFQTANPGTTFNYDFVKGDRIRFIAYQGGQFFDEYFDFEVGYYTATSQSIGFKFPPGTYPNVPVFERGTWFEIYQPKPSVPETEKLIYEIACGNIITFDAPSGKYIHNGDTANQEYWSFTATSNSGGFVRFHNGSVTHNLSAGDKIRVQQAIGFTNAAYNTYTIVSTVVDANTVDTTMVFGSPVPSQAGLITSPATGVFDGGDTFYRNRTILFNTTGTLTYETLLMEDANYSDLYSSKGYDYGRPNVIDPYAREVARLTTVYFSEQFIPETNINGMSTVYPDSFETYEIKHGSIQKFYNEDQKLNVFQEFKIGAIPVEQNIFSGTQGGTVVGTSTKVLSPTMQYYIGEWGIGTNPESFAVNGTAKYGFDVNRGVCWRLSIDGLTPISDIYFMKGHFNSRSKLALSATDRFKAIGVYDITNGEYVISLHIVVNLDITEETLAFNEKHNRWSTFYSYLPDYFCQNGVGIVSFREGELWLHDTNALQSNFYGIAGDAKIEFYLNSDPSNVKIAQAISEESTGIWELDSISNPNGQTSNLIAADFTLKEGIYYAPLWRDTNTPNVTNPLFEGDEMRAETFYLQFRYAGTTKIRTFAINMNYIISNLHNR